MYRLTVGEENFVATRIEVSDGYSKTRKDIVGHDSKGNKLFEFLGVNTEKVTVENGEKESMSLSSLEPIDEIAELKKRLDELEKASRG